MTESMKIRHYVMDIIYHGGNRPVKLLSIRMLAEKFGVACSTVSLVLDKLEKEGFVAAKHGVGVFTVPAQANWGDRPPLVGLLLGYGRHFFYDATNWGTLSCTGTALIEQGFNIRPIQLFGLSEDAIFEELRNSYLDGLIWMNSNEITAPLLKRLEATGVSIATLNTPINGFNDVSHEGKAMIPEAAATLATVMERMIRRKDFRVEHLLIHAVKYSTNVSAGRQP